MTSEGTLLPPEEVSREPARLLLSGPAGGLVAADESLVLYDYAGQWGSQRTPNAGCTTTTTQ